MSNVEELMLSRWKELNRKLPPAEHLRSSIIDDKLTPNKKKSEKKDALNNVNLRKGFANGNERRNKMILRLHQEGLEHGDIAQAVHVNKNVVIGVVNREKAYLNLESTFKDFDKTKAELKEDALYISSLDRRDSLETHVFKYGGKKAILRIRHYYVINALMSDSREYFPTMELINVYYGGRELPKHFANCFRKYMREIRSRIEPLGITIINKPTCGYKLVLY